LIGCSRGEGEGVGDGTVGDRLDQNLVSLCGRSDEAAGRD